MDNWDIIQRKKIDLGKGAIVMLCWREGKNGQRDEYSIEADRRGFRHLEKLARAKVQTVDEFCGDLMGDAFPAFTQIKSR